MLVRRADFRREIAVDGVRVRAIACERCEFSVELSDHNQETTMTKRILAKAMTIVAIAVLFGVVPARALVCTDLPAIPGSSINCTSSGNCFAKAAGSACGNNQKCVAYARRLFGACCTCPDRGPAANNALRCAVAQTKAEARFMQCHVGESARASLMGVEPNFGRCIARLVIME